MTIGFDDGTAYESELHLAHDQPMELDPTFSSQPYDDGPTMAQQTRDMEEKPSKDILKLEEREMEEQNNLPRDENYPQNQPRKIGNKLLQSPYEQAQAAMDLNPQERSLYERHLRNLTSKGGVDNPDGSRSSLYVGTYGVDDKTYVLPRVRDGQILSADDAFNAAKKEGLDNYPSYKSSDDAEKRYMEMHKYMEEDTKAYLDKQKSKDPFGTRVEGKNQDRLPKGYVVPSLAKEQTAQKL